MTLFSAPFQSQTHLFGTGDLEGPSRQAVFTCLAGSIQCRSRSATSARQRDAGSQPSLRSPSSSRRPVLPAIAMTARQDHAARALHAPVRWSTGRRRAEPRDSTAARAAPPRSPCCAAGQPARRILHPSRRGGAESSPSGVERWEERGGSGVNRAARLLGEEGLGEEELHGEGLGLGLDRRRVVPLHTAPAPASEAPQRCDTRSACGTTLSLTRTPAAYAAASTVRSTAVRGARGDGYLVVDLLPEAARALPGHADVAVLGRQAPLQQPRPEPDAQARLAPERLHNEHHARLADLPHTRPAPPRPASRTRAPAGRTANGRTRATP
jgi:hypothetical protein